MLTLDATFIFVFISFVIFIFLMKLICYGPITKIIAEREKFYAKNNKTVEETKSKKDDIVSTIKDEISKTKLESSKMLKTAADANTKTREEAIHNKKQEISNSMLEFENKLQESAIEAKTQLKDEISGYVRNAVSIVLEVNLENVNFDESKIDETIK